MGCAPSQAALEPGLSENESVETCRRLVAKGSVEAAVRLLSESEVNLELVVLGRRGSAALGAALASETCRVETLRLRKCQLTSFGAADKLKDFSAGLGQNSTVRILDLSGNSIDDYSAEHLATAIGRHTSIEILDLQANAIGGNGGGCGYRALAKALANHPTIVEVRVGGNKKEGLADFVVSLVRARSLKALYLADPGGRAPNRAKCEVCGNVGHAARAACELLAAARPDLMICYNDAQNRTRFLNEPFVHWEPVVLDAEATVDIDRARPV